MLVIWLFLVPLLCQAFRPSHPIGHQTVDGEASFPPPFASKSSMTASSLKFYLSPDGTLTANQDLKFHTLLVHELSEVKGKQLLFVAHKGSHTVFYRSPTHGIVLRLFAKNGQTVPKHAPILQLLRIIIEKEADDEFIWPVVSESDSSQEDGE